jgi:hypothetical protein
VAEADSEGRGEQTSPPCLIRIRNIRIQLGNESLVTREMLIVMRALGLAFFGAIIFMSNTAKSYGINCPNKCMCRATLVDCSNKGLVAIPENIPSDTVKL